MKYIFSSYNSLHEFDKFDTNNCFYLSLAYKSQINCFSHNYINSIPKRTT